LHAIARGAGFDHVSYRLVAGFLLGVVVTGISALFGITSLLPD
jgi:hypothetical protein